VGQGLLYRIQLRGGDRGNARNAQWGNAKAEAREVCGCSAVLTCVLQCRVCRPRVESSAGHGSESLPQSHPRQHMCIVCMHKQGRQRAECISTRVRACNMHTCVCVCVRERGSHREVCMIAGEAAR